MNSVCQVWFVEGAHILDRSTSVGCCGPQLLTFYTTSGMIRYDGSCEHQASQTMVNCSPYCKPRFITDSVPDKVSQDNGFKNLPEGLLSD